MWIGWIEFDILLGDVHSLKGKRSVVRPLLAELKRRFDVSVAEVGDHDQYRRSRVGVGLVAADRAHLVEVLDAVDRFVAGRPEIELLSARQREIHSED
ncbi:DUF503 domain-containing protein [Arthrobacter nitrophenolicus]|uniref:Uncharacterized protein YlxP (DUF503 family) n=2 Tax=Arthrobacter nitrophenolicus TaxID=683150 RepID=A0ACC6TK51_9MICC|nr:DUF503 domain-containing protein [Arthrobacter nitrophenolicus]ELT43251.1 hypothetical protein G205_19491 [Arthrobacter nitrophenolicus]